MRAVAHRDGVGRRILHVVVKFKLAHVGGRAQWQIDFANRLLVDENAVAGRTDTTHAKVGDAHGGGALEERRNRQTRTVVDATVATATAQRRRSQ